MVNSNPSIEVYCTRPSCNSPRNLILEESLIPSSITEIRCSNCGMPIILGGHFLPLRLLVPDEERGGFGRTFLAQDISFPHRPRRVIKQLHPRNPPGRPLSPSELQRTEQLFQREANILAELNHQQIPRAWAFFVVEAEQETSYLQNFFYLVQDYIEGQDLAQVLRQRGQFSEDEVVNILKEILKILRYVHNYERNLGAIHRDIKPSNIMRRSSDGRLYLIDFGAVRQVVIEGLPADQSSVVVTPDFAPPEQFAGERVSPASDLYALAATCVCLLTGRNPRELLLNSNWRQHASVNNERFANVLDWMLKYKQKDRPQSAQEVLDALSAKQQPNLLQQFLNWTRRISRPQRWVSLSFLALLAVVIAVILGLISSPPPKLAPVKVSPTLPPESPFAKYFSRGEDALIDQANADSVSQECREAYSFKTMGIKAFKKAADLNVPANFLEAEKYFKTAIDQSKLVANQTDTNQKRCQVDPETLIYYYNSKAAKTLSAKSLQTIAVVIPSNPEYRDIALEILRGVAQVQQEQSEQNPSAPLQILIAQENSDNTDTVRQVAKYISENNIPGDIYFSQSKILGVIGHSRSKNTWLAGNIYGSEQLDVTKKLVMISPTSTAIRKPNFSLVKANLNKTNLNKYVFRTASNDSIAASDLVDYMWDKLQLRRALIAYEPDESYSKSLRKEFTDKLIFKQINPNNHIQYCNLTIDSPEICIQIAKNANVQAVILAPSYETIQQARKIADLANQRFQLLAGDVLYDKKTLDLKDNANGMVVAVFSHVDIANANFTKKAEELWGREKVSWRTITSYDAAQAFVQALTELRKLNKNNPTRQEVYERLNDWTFSAPGATANVEFNAQDKNDEHDRKPVKGVGVLVQVQCKESHRCYFTLIEKPEQK